MFVMFWLLFITEKKSELFIEFPIFLVSEFGTSKANDIGVFVVPKLKGSCHTNFESVYWCIKAKLWTGMLLKMLGTADYFADNQIEWSISSTSLQDDEDVDEDDGSENAACNEKSYCDDRKIPQNLEQAVEKRVKFSFFLSTSKSIFFASLPSFNCTQTKNLLQPVLKTTIRYQHVHLLENW